MYDKYFKINKKKRFKNQFKYSLKVINLLLKNNNFKSYGYNFNKL